MNKYIFKRFIRKWGGGIIFYVFVFSAICYLILNTKKNFQKRAEHQKREDIIEKKNKDKWTSAFYHRIEGIIPKLNASQPDGFYFKISRPYLFGYIFAGKIGIPHDSADIIDDHLIYTPFDWVDLKANHLIFVPIDWTGDIEDKHLIVTNVKTVILIKREIADSTQFNWVEERQVGFSSTSDTLSTKTYNRYRYHLLAFDIGTGKLDAITTIDDPPFKKEYYKSDPDQDVPFKGMISWADSLSKVPTPKPNLNK
jgi:hypothetical protein